MLASTHELGDGSRVRLRLTRPTDLPKIEPFLESLNSEVWARRLAFYDPRERLVVAATSPGDVGEEIVGLAEVTLAGAADADVTVLAGDRGDAQGLAMLLSDAAASLAEHRAARRRSAA